MSRPGKRSSRSDRDVYASRRRAAVRLALRRGKIGGLLITDPMDVGYLSGFSGEDSFLLILGREAVLITDGRYVQQARRECPSIEVHCRYARITQAVGEVLKGRSVRRLGIQGEHVTLQLRDALQTAIGSRKLVPLLGVISALQVTKDESEIRTICRAVRIAERAFLELTAGGAKRLVGRSERQVAAELDHRMRDLGADGSAFETIVAAGAHGALPHYRPGGRVIRRNEAVLVDWGARVAGYCSDLTRVVFTGTIPPKVAEMYEVVLAAQQAAIRAIRPGIRCGSADAAAREVIRQAGFGERFVHGLGHGIGRRIHEPPALARGQEAILRAGMIVTVEPGVYVPGLGGVRIEDNVLVTYRGARRLSRLPRRLEQARLR